MNSIFKKVREKVLLISERRTIWMERISKYKSPKVGIYFICSSLAKMLWVKSEEEEDDRG